MLLVPVTWVGIPPTAPGCSSVWPEFPAWNRDVGGSNPPALTKLFGDADTRFAAQLIRVSFVVTVVLGKEPETRIFHHSGGSLFPGRLGTS